MGTFLGKITTRQGLFFLALALVCAGAALAALAAYHGSRIPLSDRIQLLPWEKESVSKRGKLEDKALADVAAGFVAKVPRVSIALDERPSGDILEGLREGATDVGVVLEGAPMDGLQAFEYATDQLVAILPRAHALKDKRVPFSTLLDHDFVGLDAGNAISRLLQDQAAVAHKPLRLRVQVRSFAALCKMVSAGMGIGILPEGAAKPMLTALRLRMVQLTDVWATRRMYVCVRNYDLLPTVAKSLVDTLTHDRRGGEVAVPRT